MNIRIRWIKYKLIDFCLWIVHKIIKCIPKGKILEAGMITNKISAPKAMLAIWITAVFTFWALTWNAAITRPIPISKINYDYELAKVRVEKNVQNQKLRMLIDHHNGDKYGDLDDLVLNCNECHAISYDWCYQGVI